MINMPGGPEMMVIILVALIVLGPQQLPKAMRTMGNVMAEIRKISSGFQTEMKNAMDSITDDGSSKPQSGTMTAATPVEATSTPFETTATEVVARNDGPAEAETSAGTDGSDGPARPAIDPADRAAG